MERRKKSRITPKYLTGTTMMELLLTEKEDCGKTSEAAEKGKPKLCTLQQAAPV